MEIKPCPICGREPEVAFVKIGLWASPCWVVECHEYGKHAIYVTSDKAGTREEAIEKWNAICKGANDGD